MTSIWASDGFGCARAGNPDLGTCQAVRRVGVPGGQAQHSEGRTVMVGVVCESWLADASVVLRLVYQLSLRQRLV